MGAIALVALVIYYIRWNDLWFRQHADEEFRLKRLDLDIDRASWVVEMALEWSAEKNTGIPQELIDRLTRNLFEGGGLSGEAKHPSQDLASALLGASSGLCIRVPGLGEIQLDRRGIRRFKEAANETKPSKP